jgi:hypothetical protein
MTIGKVERQFDMMRRATACGRRPKQDVTQIKLSRRRRDIQIAIAELPADLKAVPQSFANDTRSRPRSL